MRSTEFLRDTLIPMMIRADEDWQRKGPEEVTPMDVATRGSLLKGQFLEKHVPQLFLDKIFAAVAHELTQQKGFEIHANGGRIYRLFIVSPNRKRPDSFYQHAVYQFYLWIHLLTEFAPEECSREMNVYLYLLPDKKVLPTTSFAHSDNHGLSIENINTAFTRTCSEISEINIFREDEWFKVLMHETFHNHGLDFSLHFDQYDFAVQEELKLCFPALQSTVLLFESYCEFWAEMLHSLFVAFFQSKSALCRRPRNPNSTRKKSKKKKNAQRVVAATTACNVATTTVWKRAQKILIQERDFSTFQCVKVLNHYGLTYTDLVSSSSSLNHRHFSETTTNAFAYYVIKCIMFHCDFLDWHLANNGPTLRFSDENILGFCRWLQKWRKTIIPHMKHMEQVYHKTPKTSPMSKTLRMVLN